MLIKQIWMKISGIIVYNKKKTRCYFHSISEIMWGVGKWRGCGRAGNSLKSLRTNEPPWAIRSDRSKQMSDCEHIAQVAHEKWAIMSDSLRLLRENERFAQVAHQKWAIRSCCSPKMSECEGFAQVTQHKRVNEQIAQNILINS